MAHVIEHAASGRARCRGCEQPIGKGELRFGERQPNAFGEGEMTLWFHLWCGAYKRPEAFLEALDGLDATATRDIVDADELRVAAKHGIAHRRLPRVNGADRAPTGRARCRHCKELIDKDSWRIGLVYFEEYRFAPSGYIHAACAQAYLETIDILDRVRCFSPDLEPTDVKALKRALKPSSD